MVRRVPFRPIWFQRLLPLNRDTFTADTKLLSYFDANSHIKH
jgi:hypothetical protein